MSQYFFKSAQNSNSFSIPSALIEDPKYKGLSNATRVLYSYCVDLTALSVLSNWYDKDGKLYIIYSPEEIQKEFNCSSEEAKKMLDDLQAVELIEIKDNKIYPKKI